MSMQKGVAKLVAFGSLTTAGAANTTVTPTVVVSKDGGGQATATNAPTHLGNGQWQIQLTATEMNADLIAVTAVGSGLVPSYLNIYTEADYTPTRAGKIDYLDGSLLSRQSGSSPVTLPTTAPTGYGGATAAQVASAVLATPANLLATDASGRVSVNLSQAVPTSNTAQTVGDALNAARAQGFGKWSFNAGAKTLTLYAADGTTVVRTFTLDDATNPSVRS